MFADREHEMTPTAPLPFQSVSDRLRATASRLPDKPAVARQRWHGLRARAS
jgi:hypothetical protein